MFLDNNRKLTQQLIAFVNKLTKVYHKKVSNLKQQSIKYNVTKIPKQINLYIYEIVKEIKNLKGKVIDNVFILKITIIFYSNPIHSHTKVSFNLTAIIIEGISR